MEQKSANAAIVVIAMAVVIVVAMVCGLVMWVLQRQMSLSERLLDVRLAEAEARRSAPAFPSAPNAVSPTPRPDKTPAPAPTTPTPQTSPHATTNASPTANDKTSPTTSAAAVGVPSASKPAPPRRKAPLERKDAKVGPDGQPLDRIILPVGNDDLDWQF